MTHIEKFKAYQVAIRLLLQACAGVTVQEIFGHFKRLGPRVIAHLYHKYRLYEKAQKKLAARGEVGPARLLAIFEQNMHMLAAAVRAFFDECAALLRTPELLLRRFHTVSDVLKSRFETEEKAVLPLFARCEDALR